MNSKKDTDWKKFRPATRAVRAGHQASSQQEHSEAIFTTSSFVFDNAEQAASRFSYEEEGSIYSRFTNPTVQTFEQRLATLEGGERCVATSSGMSALLSICMSALKTGDHVVSSRSIFGASYVLFTNVLTKYGIDISFVDLIDLKQWQSAITSNTKLVFFETPSNPLTELGDISEIAQIAQRANPDIKVVVDNCFCTPILQRPIELGADVVMHSATKFIDGQGRCVGGAVVGDEEFVGDKVLSFMRTCGPSMSPFNAWVFTKGLETMGLRVNQSCDNALELAQWLENQDKVSSVYYPGLTNHPQHDLAKRQQSKAGAIVSFKVNGDQTEAFNLINSTELLSITANLGDTKSTITHPFTTTHARWSIEDKDRVGISSNLIRISVGIEDIEDIKDDLRYLSL